MIEPVVMMLVRADVRLAPHEQRQRRYVTRVRRALDAERARLVDIRDGRHVRPVLPRWDSSRRDLFTFAENGHVRGKVLRSVDPDVVDACGRRRREQRIDEMRPGETRAARGQNPHQAHVSFRARGRPPWLKIQRGRERK